MVERIVLVLKPRLFPAGKCKFCGARPTDNLHELAEHLLKHPKQVVKELESR